MKEKVICRSVAAGVGGVGAPGDPGVSLTPPPPGGCQVFQGFLHATRDVKPDEVRQRREPIVMPSDAAGRGCTGTDSMGRRGIYLLGERKQSRIGFIAIGGWL